MRSHGNMLAAAIGSYLVWSLAGCTGETREPPRAIAPPVSTTPLLQTPDLGSPTAPDAAAMLEMGSGQTSVDETSHLLAQAFISVRPEQVLDIDGLLTKGDVRELTGYTGELNTYPLQGQLPSESYNAERFGLPTQFGVGIQVWALDNAAETSRHYGRLRETYVGAEEQSSNVGDRLFRADFAGVLQLVFMSRRHGRVVAISCSETFCAEEGAIERMAELVHSRM